MTENTIQHGQDMHRRDFLVGSASAAFSAAVVPVAVPAQAADITFDMAVEIGRLVAGQEFYSSVHTAIASSQPNVMPFLHASLTRDR